MIFHRLPDPVAPHEKGNGVWTWDGKENHVCGWFLFQGANTFLQPVLGLPQPGTT